MFKTLRKKFILVAMLSVMVVLTLIIGSINIFNYYNVVKDADAKLAMIADGGGTFIMDKFGPQKDDSKKSDDTPPEKPSEEFLRRGFNAETPFNTRYFTITLNEDGSVSTVNTDKIASVTASTATGIAKDLAAKDKTSGKGFYEGYRYTTTTITDDDGNNQTIYIFLDLSQDMRSFEIFLLGSIGISLIGLLLVFLLVFFSSKRIVRPMAESYEKQKQFITDASHELKTPLAVISANTEVIELETGETDWTRSITRQIGRLNSLVEKLVFLSRMDEENPRIEHRDLDFSKLVLDTTESFEAVATSRNKTLTMDIQPDIHLEGDEKSLVQLLSLLVDNACKYSNDGGSIETRLITSGSKKILTIYNTCENVPVGNLDQLFERFYRLDSSRNSKTGGYGIGLSVAKAIVHAHKGKITAASEDGKSIVFTITF